MAGQTGRGNRLRCVGWVVPFVGFMAAPAAVAQEPGGPPPGVEQPALEPPKYPVSRFVITYATPNPGLPDPEDVLRNTTVTLGTAGGGYVEPREGLPTVSLSLADLSQEPVQRFNLLALSAVVRAVFEEYQRRGLGGLVADASADIYLPLRRDPDTGAVSIDTTDPNAGRDLRPEKRPDAPTELHLIVYSALVTQVRTQATGQRIGPDEDPINSPLHERIRSRSPVQPFQEGAEGERRDLLRKDLVDEYIFRLSRHPGRRVDAAVSAGGRPGEITLDYLVNESSPWTLFFQISNTGTKQTNEWRQRFGFGHTQLTGRDDILSLEYVTAGFDQSHALIGSYEAPVGDNDWLRGKVYGNWNQFTASEVGFSNQEFEGDGWIAGVELMATVYQEGKAFVDVFGGFRWQYVSVTNSLAGTFGDSDFLLPYAGLRFERQTDVESTFATVSLEGNMPDLADTDTSALNNLGRLNASDDWIALRGEASHSFFLEPILAREAWEDPERSPSLAHEVSVSVKGQYAFDYRLIPNAMQVIGGFYTVRGYEESIGSGDSMWVGSVEYRWHIPWGLKHDPQPGTLFGESFRYRPQQPYGRADWDLVARAFVDVGQTFNSDKSVLEFDETLVGAGLGAELVIKRNFSVRADWGIALKDTESGILNSSGNFIPDVTAGSSRFHISATILY